MAPNLATWEDFEHLNQRIFPGFPLIVGQSCAYRFTKQGDFISVISVIVSVIFAGFLSLIELALIEGNAFVGNAGV
jgi:hypothetical protein